MQTNVEAYFVEGCLRCKFGATPHCKVLKWKKELKLLREFALSSGLKEEIKWGVPCYTLGNKNVLIVSAFKDYCSIAFFKGALLSDPEKLLVAAGENSAVSRSLRFTDVKGIAGAASLIPMYIQEAIQIEQAGLKVPKANVAEMPMPEEFATKLKTVPGLKEAFSALTPGRQRAYLLHFSQAKQSKTREARIETHLPAILRGKGFNE